MSPAEVSPPEVSDVSDVSDVSVESPVSAEPVSPVSPVFAEYRRHNADVRGELTRLLGEVARAYPGAVVRGAP